MKGKRFIISAAVAAGLLGLSACALARSEGSGNSADNVWTAEKVYARAQELGYTGTLEEFLSQLKGADGVGVSEIAIENENLIVKLTDGKVIDCGRVTGKSGVGLAGAEIDENGNLILTLSDGSELPLGKVTGSVGEDGKGIRDILLNEEGELVVYFTDDTEKNVGVIKGENGVGIAGVTFGEDGSLIFTMTDKSTINCGRPPVCSHTYSEWELGRAATCTSIGYYTHTCSKCGNVEYDFIEETGHVYDEWQDMISTCVSRWQVRSCTVCGDSQVISAEPVVEHRFSDGVCVVCGMEWEDLDLSYLDAYNGTYGYEYLGTVNNGEALQSLYEAIDREVRRFHTDTGLDAGEDFAVASIDYAQFGLDADEAVSVWKTYRDDNPLYYWLSGRVAYTADCITLFTESDYDSGRERYFYNNLIYKTVDEYSSRLEKSDTIYRKALGYHDFIIEAVDYAYTADKQPETAAWAHNILGVFEGAGAVCEGYARSFQILLNYSGIENLFVTGTADGEAHAWNLVRLDDGGWYWCDLTWDDRADSWKWGIVYNYFCVNDSVNTLWSEGGWIYDSTRTFLDTHTFDTSAGTGAGFLYELPARSAGEFSGGAQDLLNTEFTVGNCDFTVVGYNTVELNYIAGSGAVEIPETVTYNGITYTVISLGVRGSEKSGIVIGWGITSVHVPETVKFIWDFAFRQISLENIYVDEKNPRFCSRDGVLFTKSLYTLISYPSANARTEYVIPDETYEIAYWSFDRCKYLETLTFGRNVSVIWITNWGSGYHDSKGSGGNIVSGGLESIQNALAGKKVILIDENNKNYAGDDFAVYNYDKSRILYVINKGITSYNLPANLASVESEIFSDCTKLESFTVEEGNQWFGTYGGVLYDKDLTRIIFVPRAIKGEVEIPDSVTSIGAHAFSGCSKLTSIIIPDGVTSIGDRAFSGCSSLTSIGLPDGVTSIGDHAFSGCDRLTSIVLPDGVTSIGDHAFSGCDRLTSIGLPDDLMSIGKYAFYDCYSLTDIIIPKRVASIGDHAFSGCVMTSIVIPDSVTSIGDYVFAYCESLTSVVFPDSLTSIGDYTFWGCDSLTSIMLPDSLTSIGDCVFLWCSGLTSIVIPDGVTSIGYRALSRCAMTSIIIPKGVTSIGGGAFESCSWLTSITLPEGVTSIGNLTFSDCIRLTSIEIPDGVTSIGDRAFEGCSRLTSIVLPDSITSIGAYAFEDCVWLESIVLPDGITSIGGYAFEDCIGLTSIEIPDSVTSIGFGIFSGCSGLTSIIIPDSITSIEVSMFRYCRSLTSIIIPKGVTSIRGAAFEGCKGLTSIEIPDSITSIGECAFEGCSSLTSIVIPDSVTSIGGYAFYACSGLTSIVIPDSVTSIGEYTFVGCVGLTSIIIPDGITSIEGNVFQRCVNLTSIVLPDGITSIKDWAFEGCGSLTSIVLPDGVTSIGEYAFSLSGLTSVVIPDSVTSIGEYAFYYCRGLTSVYYKGTAESWGAITIKPDNDSLLSAALYYYSESEPALNAGGTAYEGNYWHYAADGKTPVVWKKEN